MSTPTQQAIEVRLHRSADLAERRDRWEAFAFRGGPTALSDHPAWLEVLEHGLGHEPYCLEAVEGDEVRGLLPLAFVRSLLFGRFLVSLPYLNYGGVLTDDDEVARSLIDRAIELAERLDVQHLELRHAQAIDHPRLTTRIGHKVHMRMPLPATVDELWKQLKSSVRNQIRKGQKSGLTIAWGGKDLFEEFYDVFSRNMRDLGTPVYKKTLFHSVIRQFPDRSEFCVVRLAKRPIAAALLLHGQGVTEVPSASSLRPYNNTCANMLMYWNLLERATLRGQELFDFGRSTPAGPVHRFKTQWGAVPAAAEWQYLALSGNESAVRPDNPRYRKMISLWRRLPLSLTRWMGPPIVRGIP